MLGEAENGDHLEDVMLKHLANTHLIYRVIHRSLQDFQPLWYSSQDGHAKVEHVNRGRDEYRCGKDV
jgi:hypothetical protein